MATFKFRNFIVLSAEAAARYTQTAKLPPAWIYSVDALIAQNIRSLEYMYSTTQARIELVGTSFQVELT
jgi:hypothetical protein